MPARHKIPKEIEAYVIAHINDRPRTKVAKDCGICISSLYSIVRKYNGELRYGLSRKHDNIEDIIRKMWPTMTAKEIAEKTGISKSVIIRWRKRLGVEHTPETMLRISAKRANILDAARNDKACQAKRTSTLKHVRRMEEIRFMSGMKQKTRLRIKVLPDKVYNALWNLEKKYNYFFETNAAVAYYDSLTNRNPNEAYYTKKYGIRFVEADD